MGGALALEVPDVDAALARLAAAGHPAYVGPGEGSICRMAFVQDPDGNSLMVHRCKPANEHCPAPPVDPAPAPHQAFAVPFVAYPVHDVARAAAFYEGVLGLRRARAWGPAAAPHWIEYDLGPQTLALTNGEALWQPGAEGGSVAFEVDDLDAAVAAVRAAGQRVDGPIESPVCTMWVAADSEGNSLILHRRKACEGPAG